MDSERMLLLIMSMVGGAVIGELINIDKLMNRFGSWAERKLGFSPPASSEAAPSTPANSPSSSEAVSSEAVSLDAVPEGAAPGRAASKRSFSQGFVSASIIFCTGSMAIVGSLQSGLQGNHETLFAKSILDGSISLVFGASMGIGVAFSALPVLVYQGGIVLASLAIRDYLTADIVREMSAVGSLLIAAIGFNFLSVKEIKVANLIPGIFIPWAWLAITQSLSI
jgi:uncharacterized membrane protein YqgA involved in biofilm formation